jgi:signal transduction histidine kinase
MRLFRELEATAADLRRAIAVKDDFLGMVSHELKTPITTVMGNAAVLRRSFDAIDKEARDGALADIVEETGRLNRIIDDLLVLARLDQGDELAREPIIVRRVVERLVDAHLRQHASRKIDLRASGVPAPILGAPAYMEHVIRNLLSNAEKYSPAFEPIDVRVERDQEEVRVIVLDRGHGVPDDERERIFEPFYRSPASAMRVGGIGVGLAVCRRIIEAQNGRIWVAPRDGGGSEFGFALPLADDDFLESD